jgi:DsbC/DsbD-like thiol-disulfide interchange protein
MLLCLIVSVSLPLPLFSQINKLLVQPPDLISVKPGAAATAVIKVSIMPGFHVNSDKPRDEFLIPLKLTWPTGPLEAQATTYPQPEQITVGKDNLLVYTGKFTLETKFTAPANAPKGATTMTGKLRYQACNSQMCFRPSSVDVRLPVSIE